MTKCIGLLSVFKNINSFHSKSSRQIFKPNDNCIPLVFAILIGYSNCATAPILNESVVNFEKIDEILPCRLVSVAGGCLRNLTL